MGCKKILAVLLVSLITSANLRNVSILKSIDKSNKEMLIFILLWTFPPSAPISYWAFGRLEFIRRGCSVANCFITRRRNFFGGHDEDIMQFDAILFDGRNLRKYNISELPRKRSGHQKYIFLDLEASVTQPICDPIFDSFFNWTATYKLNSDIVLPYFSVRNKAGQEIGPRINMTWNWTPWSSGINVTLRSVLRSKSKAVAWFVSRCRTTSRREDYAKRMQESLKEYNLTLDVFGKCGTNNCSRSNERECLDLLRRTYYFYLSFENTLLEDYVTEKVFNPLIAGAVPIVYGGADYSRFLPPKSYIDASKYTPKRLAAFLSHLITAPAKYEKFFRWTNHFSYHKPRYACALCAALNDKKNSREHHDFRSWWNPGYKKWCKSKSKKQA